VWLGPTSRGGSATFKPADWFSKNGKLRENTPMYFLYGKDDPAASMVPSVFAALRKPPDNTKSKHNFDKDEKLNTKLAGQELVSAAALKRTIDMDYPPSSSIRHPQSAIGLCRHKNLMAQIGAKLCPGSVPGSVNGISDGRWVTPLEARALRAIPQSGPCSG